MERSTSQVRAESDLHLSDIWTPPFLAPDHCAHCRDGWIDQTVCPQLLIEQQHDAKSEMYREVRLKIHRGWDWRSGLKQSA